MRKFEEYIDPDMKRFLNGYDLDNMSERRFFHLLEEIDLYNRDEDGSLCILYPRIMEQKASREYTCNISNGIIRVGSPYYRYTLFMENLSRKKKFVLKKPVILESEYYSDCLPSNMFELNEFNRKVMMAENGYDFDSKIDFGEFGSSYGTLDFRELKKSIMRK